jgi:transcriptional regulator with XRE-family HTH domain
MSHKRIDSGYGDRLYALRKLAKLTQKQLAERAGLNTLGVAKLEQGRSNPDWVTALALADALGRSLDEFRAAPPEPPAAAPKRRRPAAEK